MPWDLLALFFFVDVVVWIATGFMHVDYSFSLSFFSIFYVALIATIIRARRRHIDGRLPAETVFVRLSWIWLWTVVTMWTIGVATADRSAKGTIFDLLIPVSIALAHLMVWSGEWSERTWRSAIRVVGVVMVCNVVASFLIIWLVNLTSTVPRAVFFLNPHYPVILFKAAGRVLVRTPGIFESGGTNGSFFLLGFAPVLAYLLFGRPSARARVWFSLVLLLLAIGVVATFTRRSLIAVACCTITLGTLSALAKRRYALVGLASVAILAVVVGAALLLPGF